MVITKGSSSLSSLGRSSGGDGPETLKVGRSVCMLSADRAFRHNRDCDPCLLMNSMVSKPGPSDDINIAELIRDRGRFRLETPSSNSLGQQWACCNLILRKNYYFEI